MELRDWAVRILSSDSLLDKLHTPEKLTDKNPGAPYLFSEPVRSHEMRFQKRTKEEKLPAFHEHGDSDKRAVCLHRFCGHELLAVEIMAQALLLFPDSPKSFRMGVANTLKEEQEHVRLYQKRLLEMGVTFGDMPLYRHFWVHVPYFKNPTTYVSVMSLTFEMANLDFAPLYAKSFQRHEDLDSELLMNRILTDEIKHVAFGYRMLTKMNPKKDSWETYASHLTHFLTPKRAKGFLLHPEPRKKAGIPDVWIEKQSQL